MTTTAQGTELARRFQLALREIEYGLEEVHAAQGLIISRLAIGNIPHSNHQMLSAAINALLVTHPDARVQVVDGHYEALLNDLRNGKLDFLFGVLRRPDWVSDVQEELLFANPYVVVGRKDHPLLALKRITLNDLARYDWIMPGSSTPRQQALERLFVGAEQQPRVNIEATSMQIYRAILACTDRLTLMSQVESQLNDDSALAVLPFQSRHLSRSDGVATRVDWQPTSIHRKFLDFLRVQAHSPVTAAEARPRGSGQSRTRRKSSPKPERRKLSRTARRPPLRRVR
jgi:DNA-binding transcriptional LysR family regulator